MTIQMLTENIDGIQFYVSNDTTVTGMSISGLARCCGVHLSTISKLFNNEGLNRDVPEWLKPFVGNVFIPLQDSDLVENNAKVVHEDVCVACIEYYAFDSKYGRNDTAKNIYRKFAKKGFNTWVKELIGVDDNKQILNALSQIFTELKETREEIKELKIVQEKYNNAFGHISNFKGLETMYLEFSETYYDLNLLEPHDDIKLTLNQWLYSKGLYLNHGGKTKFGRMVKEVYAACNQEDPKKISIKKDNGKRSNGVNVYSRKDFPLLEMALKKFISE